MSELKHFSHRSKGFVQDIFVCNGNTVKEALLEEVIKANSFGLLTDDATDIATCSQLISFVQYVNSSGNTEVSCNAVSITATVIKDLEDNRLNLEKLNGLATGGAIVMLLDRIYNVV